ncbi:hypothetical protein ABNX05_15945 [Lysinibacillus sp. M3]|uniref:Lipoprotein n=1 Tax=Lysinibacillus zambalensis TaxID=3160866 RepID=A0ABV1MVF0_9BACI
MWRMSFLAIILAALFLGGCNWGNRAVEDRPADNNVNNDVKNDVRRGADRVEDALDPSRNGDYDRDVNDANRNNILPESTTPGTTTTPGTVTPGTTTTPGTNTTGEVKEKIVEEKVTR